MGVWVRRGTPSELLRRDLRYAREIIATLNQSEGETYRKKLRQLDWVRPLILQDGAFLKTTPVRDMDAVIGFLDCVIDKIAKYKESSKEIEEIRARFENSLNDRLMRLHNPDIQECKKLSLGL